MKLYLQSFAVSMTLHPIHANVVNILVGSFPHLVELSTLPLQNRNGA
jgi:hypothetical protein